MTDISFDGEAINRYFKGMYSDKEADYVDKVFCDKDNEKELEHHLRRQWYELLEDNSESDKDLNNVLYRIHYDINTRLSPQKSLLFDNNIKWTIRIAGAIILPLLIFIGIQTYKDSCLKKEAWVEIKAPAWTRAQFSLPDGTTGWLNSNSGIKYNGSFISDRQVALTGEAFFDVFKDEKRPFKVTTDDVNLTVSGTRFNIASYENEKNVEVVLEEGRLVFNDKEMHKPFTMNPNDLVIFDKTHEDFSTEVVQPHKYLSWTEGKLVFRNDPVDVIARRLERWYNIDVEINGIFTEDIRLRATFSDEDLETVLDLLKKSLPLKYKIENPDLRPDEIYAKKKVILSHR